MVAQRVALIHKKAMPERRRADPCGMRHQAIMDVNEIITPLLVVRYMAAVPIDKMANWWMYLFVYDARKMPDNPIAPAVIIDILAKPGSLRSPPAHHTRLVAEPNADSNSAPSQGRVPYKAFRKTPAEQPMKMNKRKLTTNFSFVFIASPQQSPKSKEINIFMLNSMEIIGCPSQNPSAA